eukprot:TRINITY_DN12824_c0_g1_i1.p1 TRINITY_DN12824_c0_g1~~TRINITY_DN12824_c0_g1_i1.p1  ORF type:complete len:397 (+),score=58.85 TRINITY_DN12824_c0_g1_i1:71-1261(+)
MAIRVFCAFVVQAAVVLGHRDIQLTSSLASDTPEENRSAQCDGEDAERSRKWYAMKKRTYRCCLPDWPEWQRPSMTPREQQLHAENIRSAFKARDLNIQLLKENLYVGQRAGDESYATLRAARKEEVTDNPLEFDLPFAAASHQVWMNASALECEQYDLNQLWHVSYPRSVRWKIWSEKHEEAGDIRKTLVEPLRDYIDAAWKWRDSARETFKMVFLDKRKPILTASGTNSRVFAYNGYIGREVTDHSETWCIAVAYNPVLKQVETHKSSSSESGVAAVWNPVTQKIEVQTATGENSISGCFDFNTQQVVFREKSSCVWNPVTKQLEWHSSQDKRGLIVAGWDAQKQKVVTQTSNTGSDGGSISMLYRTPGQDFAFASSSACSFTRRRRRHPRRVR